MEYEARDATVTRPEQKTSLRKGYAFVAMAMDVNNLALEDILDAIKAGAANCKVTAERIDEAQSNERITDRTLDSIGQAGFVIVDLTYDRPNVYYEAGYAQALKKTPVYLAKQGTEIHFDVKDYPVIFYSNLRSLRSSLAERLTAIISGRANKV
jgi:nucleoside 2-deoxyribosyltransferase